MIAVAGLLMVVALGRLLASDRWSQLDPVRTRWRRFRPRATAYVRAAPGTYAYLFVLLITTWVLETSSSTIARQLLLERSTNLHHLAHDPVRVLFASAFWVSGGWELVGWVVLFTLVVAPVEHWLGTARTAAVFFLGHIGATLLTAAGLWAALRLNLVEHSATTAADVGASYGFFAVAGILTYRIPARRRWMYATVLAAYVGGMVAYDPSFTSVGHVLALSIGFACYPLRAEHRIPPWGIVGSEMETRSYTVPGMSCGHCKQAVTEEISRVNGVTEVDVDLDTKLVCVRGEGLDDGALREAIEEAGYEAA